MPTLGELIMKDRHITGAAAQSALGNNILLSSAGTTSIDCMATNEANSRSIQVQIVASAGISAGQVIFETSLDNATFAPMQMWETTSAANITAAASVNAVFSVAASANRTFVGKISGRYIRCRISTGFTGGTIQAFSRLSISDFIPFVTTLGTGQTLSTVTTVGTVTTVTTVAAVTAATLASSAVTDIASAAITTTTTSSAVSLANVTAASFSVNVTAVSGTTPTLDVAIELSWNTTSWVRVYEFERITASGNFQTPILLLPGQQVRYVRTVGGTSPSFTMSLTRVVRQVEGEPNYQFIDRTIAPNSISSTTPTYFIQGTGLLSVMISSGTATTPAVFTVDVSPDGTNWAPIGATMTPAANTAAVQAIQVVAKFARVRVSTAGSGQTLNLISINGNR